MDEEEFWQIIQESLRLSDGQQDEQLDALKTILENKSSDEIRDFDRMLEKFIIQSYHWNLWGVAYIINGGCSDDSFEYFRYWLISRGKDTYYRLLENADAIADMDLKQCEGDIFFEELSYAASEVYEEKVGKDMGRSRLSWPRDLDGEIWEEDEAELREKFPRTYEKYW